MRVLMRNLQRRNRAQCRAMFSGSRVSMSETPRGVGVFLLPALRWNAVAAFTVLSILALSALVPYRPFIGPLSVDESLPVVALGLAGVWIWNWQALRMDALSPLLLLLVFMGVLSNIFMLRDVDLSFSIFLRGPGRMFFYMVLLFVVRAGSRQLRAETGLKLLFIIAFVEACIGLVALGADYVGDFGVGVFHTIDPRSPLCASGQGRIVGTFNLDNGKGMNGLAAYFALMLPLGAVWWENKRARLFVLLAQGVIGVALLLTYTRATVAALVLGTVVMLLVAGLGRYLLRFFVSGVLLSIPLWPTVVRRFSEGTDRLALVAAALHMGGERPFLGHGDIHYTAHLFSRSDYFMTLFGAATASPHNSIALGFFRYGVWGSLLLSFLLLLPIGLCIRMARRLRGVTPHAFQRRVALMGVLAFTAFAAQSLSNNLLEVPKVAVFFFLLWGMVSEILERKPCET